MSDPDLRSNHDPDSHDDPKAQWERFTADQRNYLEQRLARISDAKEAGQHLQRRPSHSPPVLSFTQERLWFLDQLEPGSIVYNRPWGLRLSGSLDLAALEQALSDVVHRHEILRTTYAVKDGVPIQIIQPHRSFVLPIEEIRSQDRGTVEHELTRLSQQATRKPFDLSADRLFRPHLIRLNPTEHVLLLT
ncbi:MAG: hypothetical protein E4G99_13080, partial [Anaerolineales bacterium]